MKRLIVLLLLLAACSPAKVAPPATSTTVAKPAPAAPATRPAAPAPGVTTTVAPRPVPARAFDSSLLTGKEFLLQRAALGRAAVGEDFDLGVLATEGDAALDAARAFVAAAADKKFVAEQTAPRWTAYLRARSLELQARAPWTTVRWGARRNPEEGGALFEYAARQGEKVLRGMVYLAFDTKKGWLVNDLQVGDWEDTSLFDPNASATAASVLP